MRLIVILLISFYGAQPFDVPFTGIINALAEQVMHLNDTNPKATEPTKPNVIMNPAEPFLYNGMKYYWKGYYQTTSNLRKRCLYQPANHEDLPFGTAIMIANGTILDGVEFGCDINYTCHKLECQSVTVLGLFWAILLLTSMVLALLYFIRYWACRGETVLNHSGAGIEMGRFYMARSLPTGDGPPYVPLYQPLV